MEGSRTPVLKLLTEAWINAHFGERIEMRLEGCFIGQD